MPAPHMRLSCRLVEPIHRMNAKVQKMTFRSSVFLTPFTLASPSISRSVIFSGILMGRAFQVRECASFRSFKGVNGCR